MVSKQPLLLVKVSRLAPNAYMFQLTAEFTACLVTFPPEQYDRVIGANETDMTLEDLTSVVIAYADSVRHAELELAEEGEGKW